MTSFRCQRCGADYVASDNKTGREPKCPRCSVPRRRPVAEVVEEDEPLPTRRASRGSWWRRLTPQQRSLFSFFFLVGALMLVCGGSVGLLSFMFPGASIEPRAKPVPSAPPPASKINRENYLLIREGMPEDEVILILGRPTERWGWPERLSRGNVALFYREGNKEIRVHLETKGELAFNRPKVESKSSKGLE